MLMSVELPWIFTSAAVEKMWPCSSKQVSDLGYLNREKNPILKGFLP